ncbi:MAG TPA: PIN domain-containing protein [Gallionellaceae bacterium]|nr:PIN domain-containing protein [Gallionellaceae bacterium]
MSVFLDSNIVLYALGDDEAKRTVATALLAQRPLVSTQVINECSHVLRRKLQLSPAQVREKMERLLDVVQIADVGLAETRMAWEVAHRYGFSHYDSLIIAAALSAGCETLYTEDMQSSQVINERLKLLNPFNA